MTRDELASASETLEAAASDTADGDAADRLADLAAQLDRLSTADRGPDHGRLARLQSALHDLQSGAAADVADAIESANGHINEYRSTLEGV